MCECVSVGVCMCVCVHLSVFVRGVHMCVWRHPRSCQRRMGPSLPLALPALGVYGGDTSNSSSTVLLASPSLVPRPAEVSAGGKCSLQPSEAG